MNIQLSEGEVVLLKEARKDQNWRMLPTWKLRFCYQKFIALPERDLKALQEIAHEARQENLLRGIDIIKNLQTTIKQQTLTEKVNSKI